MYADDSIHIEKSDQCYTCEHFAKGLICPLLEALALGVVELADEITVQNCGFYKKFSRHLRVVDPQPGSEEGDNTKSEGADGPSQNISSL